MKDKLFNNKNATQVTNKLNIIPLSVDVDESIADSRETMLAILAEEILLADIDDVPILFDLTLTELPFQLGLTEDDDDDCLEMADGQSRAGNVNVVCCCTGGMEESTDIDIDIGM